MESTDVDLLVALDRVVLVAVGVTTVALVESGRAHDLTLPQWRALVVIGSSNGLRASDVADRIGMSRPSMSRLVRRLERRGFIAIEHDPSDGRATILRTTLMGEDIRIATMARRHELMIAALAGMPAPLPEDLVGGLEAIATAMERYT